MTTILLSPQSSVLRPQSSVLSPNMIVDIHTHLVNYDPATQGYRDFLERYRPGYFGEFSKHYAEPSAVEELLAAQGVDRAVVLAQETPVTAGMASTRAVIAFCKGASRLIPFASINPFLEFSPADALRRAVDEGCRGLKLYPSYQFFFPNEPIVYPLYATAARLDVPVVIHTGSSTFPGSRIRYADPLHLDDVAVDFPDLVIILAHAGRPIWYDRAAALARLHRNVYLDLAGLPPANLPRYFPNLSRLADKMLFGSDWPAIPTEIAENIAAFRALGLPEPAQRAVLGETAARLLGLRTGD